MLNLYVIFFDGDDIGDFHYAFIVYLFINQSPNNFILSILKNLDYLYIINLYKVIVLIFYSVSYLIVSIHINSDLFMSTAHKREVI